MAGNSFGKTFCVSTFGESHGPGIGVLIDGMPAGIRVNESWIREDLERRKPGQSKIVSQRKEQEEYEILSGVFEEHTTGAPIAVFIRNTDQRSKDYDEFKNVFRPSHADFTYQKKYGYRDHRGGGRSSARETAARVIAGSFAKMLLVEKGIHFFAFVSAVGDIILNDDVFRYNDLSALKHVSESNAVRCPDKLTAEKMYAEIEKQRKDGDTIGGQISAFIEGVPAGLGEPVFDRLHADLGKAMLSINACKGFEIGSGFAGTRMRGSEHNDPFYSKKGNSGNEIHTSSNFSGGVQGGISNGETIYFRAAFKPVATIMKSQKTVDISGNEIDISGKGRHDPCVLPRAVPIVEAMAAIVIADHYLRYLCYENYAS